MKSKLILMTLSLFILSSCLKEKTFLGDAPVSLSPSINFQFVSEADSEREGRADKGEIAYFKIYENQSEADFRKLLANQAFYYEGLFKEYKTPYPGILSNTKGCPPELTGKAQVTQEGTHFYVWAYANKRRVVGECLKKLNQYYFQKFILRCPGSKDTYQMELYLPFESYENHDAYQLSCK